MPTGDPQQMQPCQCMRSRRMDWSVDQHAKALVEIEDLKREVAMVRAALIDSVSRDRHRLFLGKMARLRSSVEHLVECLPIPEAACSCHISAPCNDCTEYGGLREAVDEVKAVLSSGASGEVAS
jgi:hypothetical protein